MKLFWKIFLINIIVIQLAWSDDIPSLKVAFWNVENLFDLIDDPKINDDEFAVGGKKYVTKEIYELKLSGYSCGEIAKMYNVSRSYIATMIHWIELRLRKNLEFLTK